MKTILFVKNLILDAIFPHKCVCGKLGVLLCNECKNKIKINNTQLCPGCKKISENGRTCYKCKGKPGLTGVIILAPHEGIIKNLIWDLKYNFIKDLAVSLSEILYEKHGKFINNKNFIITAVPISKTRLRWRGYNQAELIARNLATKSSLQYFSALEKNKNSLPQVGLTRKERIKNIEGKIRVLQNFDVSKIMNKRVLIVDDVYTTGSTLEECAKVLRKAGVKEVWGIVISRD